MEYQKAIFEKKNEYRCEGCGEIVTTRHWGSFGNADWFSQDNFCRRCGSKIVWPEKVDIDN